MWFRKDLRLADNPALASALGECQRVIPIFVHAPQEHGAWSPGAANDGWLHHSLKSLAVDLAARGSRLLVRRGASIDTLAQLASQCGAVRVYWNRCYEPALRARDDAVQTALRDIGLDCFDFNGSLLYEPWELVTQGGQPFRIFTQFWKACQARPPRPQPLPAPERLPTVPLDLRSLAIDDLQLLPRISWDTFLTKTWTIGERAAATRLEEFVTGALRDYPARRDRPDTLGTSRLSPHLHHGELSPRQILDAINRWQISTSTEGTLRAAEAYVRELGWREFGYHLLHHFPHTTEQPLDSRFERFPWSSSYSTALKAWQRGKTGYPLVDAGMRELWATGWMHNRVRMITASFLVKNLRIPWLEGARWFWDTLVDADLANNTLGWQWSAGCGADAAPYFRIFNPVLQGQRFDPQGTYVRTWVPELAALPAQGIHQPWAGAATGSTPGDVGRGSGYPPPLVDLADSRRQALEAFQWIKAGAAPLPLMGSPDVKPSA